MGVRKYNIGDVFSHPVYGEYTIIGYENGKYCIRFKKTGFQYFIHSYLINHDSIKDYMYPSVYGVGYLGDAFIGKNHKKEYNIWNNMLRKAYIDKMYNVCKEWLCFKTFLEDIQELENYDKLIDKENNSNYCLIRLDKNEEYGKYNCCITTRRNSAMPMTDNFNIIYKYGAYRAAITINRKRIYLGGFDTINAAKNAVDNYIFLYYEGTDTEIPLHIVEFPMTVDECIKACRTDIYDKRITQLRHFKSK